MSAPSLDTGPDRFARLPAWLRPRDAERNGGGRTRAVETTLLLLVGALLALATINDVARQTGINHRLIADIRTWRHYTGHDFHNVAVDQQLLGPSSGRQVVCGNDVAGPPKERVQICLVVTGPTRGGVRQVIAGWYLPAHTEDDVRSARYGCFGPEGARFCPT